MAGAEIPDDLIEQLAQEFTEAVQAESDETFGSTENIERLAADFTRDIAARVRAEAAGASKSAPTVKRPADVLVGGTRVTVEMLAAVEVATDQLIAAVRAEAVAAERERIAATVWNERGLLADRERTLAVLHKAIYGATPAAGSVPVATPPTVCGDQVRGIGEALLTCDRLAGHPLPHSMGMGSQAAKWWPASLMDVTLRPQTVALLASVGECRDAPSNTASTARLVAGTEPGRSYIVPFAGQGGACNG